LASPHSVAFQSLTQVEKMILALLSSLWPCTCCNVIVWHGKASVSNAFAMARLQRGIIFRLGRCQSVGNLADKRFGYERWQ
jgi:hypothetical protein